MMTERQHGRIGDQPDQDLSLRVTHVYRRAGADWLLVHRHADPLVSMLLGSCRPCATSRRASPVCRVVLSWAIALRIAAISPQITTACEALVMAV
jgi:hypothetical protein